MIRRKLLYLELAVSLWILASILSASEPLGIMVERAEESSYQDKCKYCGRLIKAGSIHKDAERVVEDVLRKKMTEKNIKFIEDMNAKRYINVYIYRFEERRGGNFAVEKPASVGFHMHLMEGKTVGLIFGFDEYQQPLFENVLDFGKFVHRGGKWVTAEQLSAEGIEKGLDEMQEALKE